MAAEWWLGAALGVGIGGAYSAARYLTARWASRLGRSFMVVFLGGLVLRLLSALAATALVLFLVPVPADPFLSALLLTFLIGLAADIAHVHRSGGFESPRDGARS